MNRSFLLALLASAISFGRCDEYASAIDVSDQIVCQIRVLDIQYSDKDSEQEYRCIIENENDQVNAGMTYAVDLDVESVAGLQKDLQVGNVYASIPQGKVSRKKKGSRDHVVIPKGAKIKVSKGKPKHKKGPVQRHRRPGGHSIRSDHSIHSRRLAIKKNGTSTVLVLRVSAADHQASLSAKDLSNRIFGTDGDKVNLVSMYDACSVGKLKFVPASGANIVNGVGEIFLPQNVGGMNSVDVDNLVVAAGNAKYGELSKNYDHVMFCLPPGTTGTWLAYAYLNWYQSTYNDLWCGYPSAQAHEVGHNLGLMHSNEGGIAYGDQSGLMGYSYAVNEGPLMCFNGHKNWLLGWYDDRKIEVNPSSNGSWTGKLAAFVDYKSTSPSDYVIIKVGNLHLQYNRKKDFNSGTVEKGDQVTVTEGTSSHNTSNSLAGLGFGGSYRYENFNGTNALVVQVCGIFTNQVPNYVHLSIYIDGSQKSRCSEVPSASPSSQKPTLSVIFPTSAPSPTLPSNLPTLPRPSLLSRVPTPVTLTLPTSPRPTLSSSLPTSLRPTLSPTSRKPTSSPTSQKPTSSPTSRQPTRSPTSRQPTNSPSNSLTTSPSGAWSLVPTSSPMSLSAGPSIDQRSQPPSFRTSSSPSNSPSKRPTPKPSPNPTIKASSAPADSTEKPTVDLPVVRSASPSSSPSDSKGRTVKCRSNEIWFQLSLKTDQLPAETTWELNNIGNTFSLKGGPYKLRNTEYEESACVPNDSYIFQIKDLYGDGICCKSGSGSYTVSVDGVQIASGGEFGSVEYTTIMPRCASGTDRVKVQITTDYFGSETSWTVATVSGMQLMNGSAYGPWETRKDTICVASGKCYIFTIRDQWGDGMCCSYGFGGYSIEFANATYAGSFAKGYEEVVPIGASCPAKAMAAAVSGGNTTTIARTRKRRRKNNAKRLPAVNRV